MPKQSNDTISRPINRPPLFAVLRAWNVPKRYLICGYFEPQVSDRLVSYLQVIPFHIVEGKARVHYDEENYSIGDEYGARTRDLCSDSAVL